MNTKGILLAGGIGSRLEPLTLSVSKQLLPVYDKPMIFYSLSNLILSGIKDICIVTQTKHISSYRSLLSQYVKYGIKITYKSQNTPTGIPEALKICEKFVGKANICLALGDNIFFGHNFENRLSLAIQNLAEGYSSILTHPVKDPSRFGVAEIKNNKVIKLIEKPKKPKSNFAVTGLYFLTNNSIARSKKLKKSKRNETEIVDLLSSYLYEGKLRHIYTGRGTFWSDAGTPESLNDASNFVKSIQDSQGLLVASIEEILLHMKIISKKDLNKNLPLKKSNYYKNLFLYI